MVIKNSKSASIEFSSPILKFGKKGEKTGWTYIEVTPKQALQLFPDNKKSWRQDSRSFASRFKKAAI